jgi:DNA-binding GntR family transcriptional regulator
MAKSLGEAHQSLGEQVRDEIRRRILTGQVPPGERITERVMAEELGVSRIPVRDALNMLKGEGFLTEVPRRGVVVTSMSRTDVEELFDVRSALEVLSVRLATQRASAEEVAGLRRVLDDADRAHAAGDAGAMVGCNQAFHDQITAIAHNRLLASVLSPLEARLHWLLRQNDQPEVLLAEHEELLAAIASGDPDRAAATSAAHVRTSRQLVHRLLFAESPVEGEVAAAAPHDVVTDAPR